MAEMKIHYLAYSNIEGKIAALKEERQQISVQLNEALAMGDLRENSEYDAAKEAMARVVKELDALIPSLGYSQARANLNARVIEEGSVIDLCIYSVSPAPMERERAEKEQPIFKGRLLYGGVVPGIDLLRDHALDVNTPVGRCILGKQAGFYSTVVPGGHANFYVEKVREEMTPEQILAEPIFVG